MEYRFALLLLIAVFLTGCTGSTAIQRCSESKSAFDPPPELMDHSYPEKDMYRVHEQGGSGFVSINSVRESAEKRASEFCERQSKGMVILGEKASSPPYILGNFPRVEVVFAVVDKPSVVASKDTTHDAYEKLVSLKQLLDSGALTKEEFDREKAKVLRSTE
jgi:hypothetical protein